MAGKRKGGGKAPSTKLPAKRAARSNGRHSDSANLNPQNERSRSGEARAVSASVPMSTNRTRPTRGAARFVEDNAMVEISAEGQDTEFGEDPVGSSDSMDSREGSPERNQGVNNNATVLVEQRSMPATNMEEGELQDPQPGPSAKRSRGQQGSKATGGADGGGSQILH